MPDEDVVVSPMSGLPMPHEGYIAAAITLFFIGFFGFFTNLIVIILMIREKQLWTPLNVILFNLVLSDFSVSILGNPWTLASAVARRWLFGRLMCAVYGFFMSLLGISSITTLTVLSFERYVIISRPFRSRHLTHRGAAYLILGIWGYSLVLTTPPLFGWGAYVHEAANISCSVNWETRSYNATTYIVFLFALGLVVPVVVICFSYINIIRTMRKNMLAMGTVTKAESRVAVMVAVMIIAFFIAWTPYAVLALIIQFGDTQVHPGIAVVPALVAKSSICYNPIIYVGLNTQFRSAWQKLLGVHLSQETSGDVGATVNSQANQSAAVLDRDDDAAEKRRGAQRFNFFSPNPRINISKSLMVILQGREQTTTSRVVSEVDPTPKRTFQIRKPTEKKKKTKQMMRREKSAECCQLEIQQLPNKNAARSEPSSPAEHVL
ncbi:pinopsin-like [Macrosteles quadrilineatus]|uniref:pinopsin-like n=1 Tax=Macrosteles quadrilineatus TaxID=74068 RepID=UPI0023E0CCEB|nr:pinopsin-like [Macrosteles quadrilineatus]XP_054263969.1 pinopsin-like [Macrosteles quadrilineatus]